MNKELEAILRMYHNAVQPKDNLATKYFQTKSCYDDFNLIKSALERKEKLNKVWEIVKEKNPRLSLIKSMIKTNSVDFDNYNCAVFSYERLTETEFNDLVEMLEEN